MKLWSQVSLYIFLEYFQSLHSIKAQYPEDNLVRRVLMERDRWKQDCAESWKGRYVGKKTVIHVGKRFPKCPSATGISLRWSRLYCHSFPLRSHLGESSEYSVFVLFSMETSFLQSCFSLLLPGTDNSNISYSAALFRIVDMGTVSLHTSALLRSSFDLLRIYKLRYPFSNTITTKCRDLQ